VGAINYNIERPDLALEKDGVEPLLVVRNLVHFPQKPVRHRKEVNLWTKWGWILGN
jgi:hypothetical protein